MKNKQVTRNIKYIFIALLLLVITIIGGRGIIPAFADTSGYSTALTDLQKDSNFDISDYPSIPTDYSLQVIQIAESTDGELFIYVYQPAYFTVSLTATQINLSLSESVDGTTLYDLILINTSGVFSKYKVVGLSVSENSVRFYNITSIYRPWETFDVNTGNEEVINEVSYPVAQLWTVCTVNNEVNYSCEYTKVVTITSKTVGYLRYYNGFNWYHSSCDSHYVAFSCNYNMDSIIEADISFSYRSVTHSSFPERTNYGTWNTKILTINENDVAENDVGLWGDKHTWNRISSVSAFLSEAESELTSEAKKSLLDKQWVFRFYETEYTQIMEERYTEVGEVTILRLKFKLNGEVYNLGVVDNKQTEGRTPANKPTIGTDFFGWLANLLGVDRSTAKIIFYVFLGLIALSIILPILGAIFPAFGTVLKTVFKGIGYGIKYLFTGIWWLISLPFRWIKDKKDGG